jgi:hypothetical protein
MTWPFVEEDPNDEWPLVEDDQDPNDEWPIAEEPE